VIGINTAIATRSGGYQGIGFAIPSNAAKLIMDDLLKSGKVHRGLLGVNIQDVTEALAKIDTQAIASLDCVHQIAAGAQQQSANSGEIARHVEQIAESPQQNSRIANETAGMAAHLAALAVGMRGALASSGK